MNELTQRTVVAFQAGSDATTYALAAAAFVVLAVLGVLSLRGVPASRRAVLAALRVALALALVLLALRPVIRRESVATSATPVAVVVDASASMEVEDQEDGSTRLARVASWVRRSERLTELEAGTHVDWFAASGGTLRTSSRAEASAAGLVAEGGTDLLASLRQVGERYPGRARPPVLLFSDGADHGALRKAHAGGGDLAALVGPGGPVHVVAPEAGQLADLAVDLVAHDPVGFLRTPVTVRARVRSSGLPAADVPVSLLRDGKVVSARSVRVGGDEAPSAEVTFTLEPREVGESLYWLQVPVQAGEALADNNERAFSVRVVRDRLRVLQVVGRPSWDARFLRELLKRDPAIDLISFFILRNAWDDTNADVEELSLIPFPVDELFQQKLSGFDLLVFQNLDFGSYGIEAHFGEIRRHVGEQGAGLVVIGGDLAFGPDYRELDSILPVDASRATWSGESVRVALTEVGARHPIFRLGGEDDSAVRAVSDLPLEGLVIGPTATPGAQVLLRTRDAAQHPVLVTGEAGEGRVAVLLTNGTWSWSLPAVGRGESPRAYERFWQNLMRWVVRDPRAALLVLETDRRRVGPGEQVELSAHVRSESYSAEPGVPVTLTVRGVHGEVVREEKLTTGDDGSVRLPLELPSVGHYSVSALSARGEAGPLFVERVDETGELQDATVDEAFLRALAEATGGTFRFVSERGDVPLEAEREVRVEAVEVDPIWRSWPAWAIVAGLACVEWWLRRRWGLA